MFEVALQTDKQMDRHTISPNHTVPPYTLHTRKTNSTHIRPELQERQVEILNVAKLFDKKTKDSCLKSLDRKTRQTDAKSYQYPPHRETNSTYIHPEAARQVEILNVATLADGGERWLLEVQAVAHVEMDQVHARFGQKAGHDLICHPVELKKVIW